MEIKEVLLFNGGSPVGEELRPWTYKDINIVNGKVGTYDGVDLTSMIGKFFEVDQQFSIGNYIEGTYQGVNQYGSVQNTTTLEIPFVPDVLLIWKDDKVAGGGACRTVGLLQPKLGIGRVSQTLDSADETTTRNVTNSYETMLTVDVGIGQISWRKTYAEIGSENLRNAYRIGQLLNSLGSEYHYIAIG